VGRTNANVPDEILVLAGLFSFAGEITVCTKSARMLRVDFKNNDKLSTLSAIATVQHSSVAKPKNLRKKGINIR
jgi:hypothetical protein